MKIVKFKWAAACLFAFAIGSCEKNFKNDLPVITNNGLYDLYLYNVAAKTNTRITNSPDTPEGFYTFSRDSRKILFNADTNTYLINIDGTGKTRFAIRLSEPAYSFDGKEIAYTKDGDVYIINSDGTNNHQLTQGDIGLWKPVWSKDGQKIACSSDHGLCIVSPEGKVDNIIPENSATWYDWSSDSKKLVYSKFVYSYAQVFKYDVSEKTETQLTSTSRFNYEPFWMPGKDEILFGSSLNGSGSDLMLMNADGSQQKTIVHKNLIHSPYWSPDGKQITFITDNLNVAIIDLTGDNFHIINDIPGACIEPEWSPDGKYILYYRAIYYN